MVANLSRLKDDVEEMEFQNEKDKDLPRKRRNQVTTSLGVPCIPIGAADRKHDPVDYESYDQPYFAPREVFVGEDLARKQIAALQAKYPHIEWGLFTLTHTTGEPDAKKVKLHEV
jgi:hypothetical protein